MSCDVNDLSHRTFDIHALAERPAFIAPGEHDRAASSVHQEIHRAAIQDSTGRDSWEVAFRDGHFPWESRWVTEQGGEILTSLLIPQRDFSLLVPLRKIVHQYGVTKLKFTKLTWQTPNTPLDQIGRHLGIDFLDFLRLKDAERKRSGSPHRSLVVLDWGCGDGTALLTLAELVRQEGISNVRLVGFSDRPYRNWMKAPESVGFILDTADHLALYFTAGSIDLIYSHIGLSYLHGEERLSHYQQLHRLMRTDGEIRLEVPPLASSELEQTGFLQEKIPIRGSPFGPVSFRLIPVDIEKPRSLRTIPDSALFARAS